MEKDKAVAFSTVTVFHFPVVIGDNPSCSSGCPIALGGFQHVAAERERIDIYLYEKRANRRRRTKKSLAIPPDIRTRMLVERGFGLEEVIEGTTEALKSREQRQESLQKTAKENIKEFFGFANKKATSSNLQRRNVEGPPALTMAVPMLRRVTAQASTA